MEGVIEKMNIDEINLPQGWEWVKLGEVCKTTSGGTPSRSISKYYNGKIPWVKSGELDKGVILDTEEKISQEAVDNSSAKIFPKGTLLIALYGATIGKLAFLGVDAATNQAICGIYQNDQVNSQFLYYYLFHKKQELIGQGIGGAQPNISQTILKNLELPLPPLPAQQAIVSKIEELLSELDKGKQQLELAQQQLKVYRQAVLKWAFEGKFTNKDVKEGELPERWKWAKLGDVSISCLGKMLDKEKNKGTLKPYLRNTNVRWNSFELGELFEMRFEEHENDRFEVIYGDLIICEGGEPGRAAIWKEQIAGMKIQKALHRVRFSNTASAEYFLFYLNFISSTKSIDKYFTGTTIKHLTGQNLKKILYPFPTIEEQNQIVQEIESRLSVCDKVEETINQSLAQAETLRQSILKKAFKGRLVTEIESEDIRALSRQLEVPLIAAEPLTKHKRTVTAQFPKIIDGIKDTDLHAGILAMVIDAHEKSPDHHLKLSHVKGEKIAHLVEAHIGIDLGRNPRKDAAGPDDYPHLKKVENRAAKAGWFVTKRLRIGQTYVSKSGMPKIIDRVKKTLYKEDINKIEKLIQTFLPFDLEHAEVIATVYAGWNNLLLDSKKPTDEEIVYESRENWSKRKLSIERRKFFNALQWMRKHEMVPFGVGKPVIKPKAAKIK